MTKRISAFGGPSVSAASHASSMSNSCSPSVQPTAEDVPIAAPGVLARLGHQAVAVARATFTNTLDFVVPPSCPICRQLVQMDGGLCGTCWRQVPWIDGPVCNRLGLPLAYDLGPGAVSAEALANPPEFDRMRAVCTHDGVAPQLVHALKFANQRHLADALGAMMARAGRALLGEPDTVLVPVPLHPLRQLQRRYNQSALLARAISTITGAPVVHNGVRRIKRTRQQLALSRGDRLRNVRGAFKLASSGEMAFADKHVVLIDDVHTTGATLDALTQTLTSQASVTRPRQVDALVFSTTVVQDGNSTI
jgi:ComF family protein